MAAAGIAGLTQWRRRWHRWQPARWRRWRHGASCGMALKLLWRRQLAQRQLSLAAAAPHHCTAPSFGSYVIMRSIEGGKAYAASQRRSYLPKL